jgi:integrase
MPRRLTDAMIRKLPNAPEGTRQEFQDDEPRNLYLRVTSEGVKTFTLRYRLKGKGEKATRMNLGHYPDVLLSQARDLARRAMLEVRSGNDPKTLKPRPTGPLWPVYLETYRVEHVQKQKLDLGKWTQNYADNKMSVLTHNTALAWSAKHLTGITTNDVALLLEGIESPSIRRATFYHLEPLFKWAVGRGDLVASPIGEAFNVPSRTKKRERVLTPGELVTVWQHVLTAKPITTYSRIVSLLIVTGQRRREVAHARWEEFDRNAGIWTIPKERAKNKKEHIVPMTDLAWNLFDAIPRKSAVYLFTQDSNTRKPFNSFSEPKLRLDADILEALQAVGLPKSLREMRPVSFVTNPPELADQMLDARPQISSRTIPHWTLHDLRRTMSTWLNDPKGGSVQPHIVEALLNHTIKGVASTYNHALYTDPMRDALEKWEAHLIKLAKMTAMDGYTIAETLESYDNTLKVLKPKRVIRKVLDFDLT